MVGTGEEVGDVVFEESAAVERDQFGELCDEMNGDLVLVDSAVGFEGGPCVSDSEHGSCESLT